jgi:methionyl aminopeptidase
VILDGWVADAAITVPVGNVTPIAKRLLATTRASLFDAVEQCRPGNHLSDIGHAVQQRVEGDGFSVVRQLVGHGIGRDMHEDPQIPNFGDAGKGEELEEGMVFAVEPMVNAGNHPIRVASDNWSVYSQDGSLAAHFEFTVAVTADGPRILTPWHDLENQTAAA